MTSDVKTHLKNCLRQLQLSTFAANFAQQAALCAASLAYGRGSTFGLGRWR